MLETAEHERMISALLNPIAMYAFHARLSPGETAEIPGDDGEPSQCIIFDELDTRGVPFEVKGERLALLLVIRVHPQELAYARKNGGGELLRILKEHGVYPYSDLDRPRVV